jgi:integrase/recombinase XerD
LLKKYYFWGVKMYHRYNNATQNSCFKDSDKKMIEDEISNFLRKQASLSDSTRTLYGRILNEFFVWIRLNHIHDRDFSLATDDDFFDFLEEQTGWGDSYRYNAACAVKKFYRYKYGDSHPMASIRVRRAKPAPQRTMTWEELEKLLASFDTTTYKGIRDLAMATLMIDTAFRAAEVCRMDMKFLDLDTRSIMVRVKGGEWGQGVYFDYTDSCLRSWLAVRPLIAQPVVSSIFVSVGGLYPGTMITKDGLRSIFREWSKSCGIDLISPHVMRRTFATLASRSGAPSRIVQKAGRWKSITMVERYTQALNPEDLHPFSPINNLMGM